jgi:heme/copper-type cytochrome/quinol oxidase subunit 2
MQILRGTVMAGQHASLPRPVPEVETETREAVHALSTSAVVMGVVAVMFTLMLVHAGRSRAEEEEALLYHMLPQFVRVGVRQIVHQRTPWAPPLMLLRGLGDR